MKMLKKRKRIYFIRLGETDSNAQGVLQGSGINDPLNEKVGSSDYSLSG
jgi:broad specificity phosphatase PhoE